MSYDLAVFDPMVAPRGHTAFMEWFKEQTDWKDETDYNDLCNAAGNLRIFVDEMFALFPPLNGPLAKDELPADETLSADYSISNSMVYIAFSWSKAAEAAEQVYRSTARNHLGLFDASSPKADLYFPQGNELVLCSRSKTSLLSHIKGLVHLYRKLP